MLKPGESLNHAATRARCGEQLTDQTIELGRTVITARGACRARIASMQGARTGRRRA